MVEGKMQWEELLRLVAIMALTMKILQM